MGSCAGGPSLVRSTMTTGEVATAGDCLTHVHLTLMRHHVGGPRSQVTPPELFTLLGVDVDAIAAVATPPRHPASPTRDMMPQDHTRFSQSRGATNPSIESAAYRVRVPTSVDVRPAAAEAARLLDVDSDRWRHVVGVGERAESIAHTLPAEDRELLISAAWLHDIGYAPALHDTGLHSLDGARYLTVHRRVAAAVPTRRASHCFDRRSRVPGPSRCA